MIRRLRFGPSTLAYTVRYSALAYLSAVLVFPLIGLVIDALRVGPAAFIRALESPAALRTGLSFTTALVMVAVNAVMGTATAWVLVRYPLPFKSFIKRSLIFLSPFRHS